jgi:SulP family sulfate permease
MVGAASLLALARSTRSDALVLALTLSSRSPSTSWRPSPSASPSVVLALRAVARSVRINETPLDLGDHADEEHALLADHIVAYRFDGPLFFAAAHAFLLELTSVADVRVVILRMSRVTTLDATGASVLGDAITHLERRGIIVLLSGIRPVHDGVLARLGVADHLRRDGLLFADTPSAIEHARGIVRGGPPVLPLAAPAASY